MRAGSVGGAKAIPIATDCEVGWNWHLYDHRHRLGNERMVEYNLHEATRKNILDKLGRSVLLRGERDFLVSQKLPGIACIGAPSFRSLSATWELAMAVDSILRFL